MTAIRRTIAIIVRIARHTFDLRRLRALIRARGVRAEIVETVREIATAMRSQP